MVRTKGQVLKYWARQCSAKTEEARVAYMEANAAEARAWEAYMEACSREKMARVAAGTGLRRGPGARPSPEWFRIARP